MKREIICLSCVESCRGAGPKDTLGIPITYPGEHAKKVQAKSTRHLFCDSCAEEVKPGQSVVAQSIWTEHGGIQYYPWEGEYLDLSGNVTTSIDGRIVL